MDFTIVREAPNTADAIQLIDELEATLAPHYPDESRHGYSVEKLMQQGVVFFVARHEDRLAGCGGVQIYADYAELKRMYVRPEYRGTGLSKLILKQLADYSLGQGIRTLRLETGIHQLAAIGLYEGFGFQRIEPFGEYKPDPLAVFFEKELG